MGEGPTSLPSMKMRAHSGLASTVSCADPAAGLAALLGRGRAGREFSCLRSTSRGAAGAGGVTIAAGGRSRAHAGDAVASTGSDMTSGAGAAGARKSIHAAAARRGAAATTSASGGLRRGERAGAGLAVGAFSGNFALTLVRKECVDVRGWAARCARTLSASCSSVHSSSAGSALRRASLQASALGGCFARSRSRAQSRACANGGGASGRPAQRDDGAGRGVGLSPLPRCAGFERRAHLSPAPAAPSPVRRDPSARPRPHRAPAPGRV